MDAPKANAADRPARTPGRATDGWPFRGPIGRRAFAARPRRRRRRLAVGGREFYDRSAAAKGGDGGSSRPRGAAMDGRGNAVKNRMFLAFS